MRGEGNKRRDRGTHLWWAWCRRREKREAKGVRTERESAEGRGKVKKVRRKRRGRDIKCMERGVGEGEGVRERGSEVGVNLRNEHREEKRGRVEEK